MTEPIRLGKYEIQSVLGKGAMGVVYKAFDPHIERVVAIKTVRKDLVDPDLAEQFMARFKNEARAAGRLHHPNIVGVYEYGEDEANAFIAMEYVDGTGLREYLDRKASFELAAARRDHDAAAAGARLRARARRRAPRHQAGEPDPDRRAARSRSPISASRASTRRT